MLPMIGTRQVHYSELKFFVQRLGRDHRSRMLAVFAVTYRRIGTIVEHKDAEAGHIIWRRPADCNLPDRVEIAEMLEIIIFRVR